MGGKRRVAPGGMVFHVLNRGNGGAAIFDQDGDYDAFERVMGEALERVPMRILSYCVMPNHWHLVVWPREDGDLGRFMHWLTLTHVRRWHEARHTTGLGHLYQGAYKFFPVQDDSHFLIVCRYVERNALRASLVERAELWRWGSLWHRERDPEWASELLCEWPVMPPQDYLRWINEPQTQAELDAIRRCIRRGRPFGDESWQKTTAKRLGLESTFRNRGRPRRA